MESLQTSFASFVTPWKSVADVPLLSVWDEETSAPKPKQTLPTRRVRHSAWRLFAAAVLLSMACMMASHFVCGWLGASMPDYFLAEDFGVISLLLLLWLVLGHRFSDVMVKKSNLQLTIPQCPKAGSVADASKAQRRRQHLQGAFQDLQDVVWSLNDAASRCNTGCFAASSTRPRMASRGLHNFHVGISGASLLLPVEVAATQYPPDVSLHLQRLLEDRWAVLENGGFGCERLSSIPEDV